MCMMYRKCCFNSLYCVTVELASDNNFVLYVFVIYWCNRWLNIFVRYALYDNRMLVTGSIARSANLPVFSLLRGQFWGFSPRRGDTLHRWGWNLARMRGPKVPSSVPNFTPSVQRQGCRTPKLKFLLRFDRNLEYKRPAGAYPLRDFHKICRVCTTFQDALGGKIWLDLLKGLRSYGGFKLRGSGFPQIFSAP